jgi:beta-N-acetylhexosaminidase
MSIEELALRCLMPGFAGVVAPDWVRRRAASGLGGVVLYARNVESGEQLRALNETLHGERSGLLIAIDEEGGDVTRLEARHGSSYPGNLALGTAGDTDLTRRVAAAMGAELAAAGLDLDLAPDADVNTNPANPVIGARAFGSDPKVVAAHTAAWVTGLQGAGVAACAKHFPGHGDTSVDSHLDLPVVSENPYLRALEPFRAAIGAGVQSIMSAHLLVPSLDSVPATISPRIMTQLLRGELGFDGLAITDGLEMKGLSDGYGVAEGAVRALIAGCDALCIGGGLDEEDVLDEITRAIVAAVKAGRLTEGRLAEAASRVDALANRPRSPHLTAERTGIGLEAARRAIRSEGDVAVGGEAVVVKLGWSRSMAAGGIPWGIADSLADRAVRLKRFDLDDGPIDVDVILRAGQKRAMVVVVRDLHRFPEQAEKVDAILARRPDSIVVEMGLPTCRPRGASAYIATHGAARVCGEAAAEVMRP